MEENEGLFERLMDEYISGMISEEDKIKLFSLIRQSAEYKERYHTYARLNALLHVPALEAGKEQGYRRFRERLSGKGMGDSSVRLLRWGRFAAAAVLLMVLSSSLSVYWYAHTDKPVQHVLCEAIVPLGCQTKILLPDSSSVVLNSGSILKYSSGFGTEERTVYLEGEGYFEVAKSAGTSFLVCAGETRVKVTGTIFNVRAYPEDKETEVSLVEGGVNVSNKDKTVYLKPNEKAIYNQETGSLERVPCEAYKSALWTTGKLSFVNTSFPEILKSIERKYNVKIHVMSKNVKEDVFSGTIGADMPLQEVFNFIDMDKKYYFENSGSTIILRDR